MTDRRTPLSSLCTALLLGAALLCGALPAVAQDAAPAITADTVVATVGAETITEADIAFAAEDLQQELQQIPPEERKPFLVGVLIDMKVMAQAARIAGMSDTDLFKRRLQYLEERALRRAYISEKIAAGVTEEALQAAYDAFTAGFAAEEEVHAKHILVATREDADAIRAEIEAGKPFEALAAEKSTDPSAKQNGGDLGFFTRGMMVKPFEDAAFALTEPGQVSEPVESNFGWHVIRLEERRMSQPPTLDEVRAQLQQQVMFDTFQAETSALRAGVEVSIADPALAEAVRRQSEGQ